MLIHEGQRYYEDNQDDILQLLWDEILNQSYGNVGTTTTLLRLIKLFNQILKRELCRKGKVLLCLFIKIKYMGNYRQGQSCDCRGQSEIY